MQFYGSSIYSVFQYNTKKKLLQNSWFYLIVCQCKINAKLASYPRLYRIWSLKWFIIPKISFLDYFDALLFTPKSSLTLHA